MRNTSYWITWPLTLLLMLLISSTALADFSEAIREINTQRRAKDYDAAQKAVKQAIELADKDEQHAMAHQYEALVFQDMKKMEEALAASEKAISYQDISAARRSMILQTRGSILVSAKEYEKAAEVYEKIADMSDAPPNTRAAAVASMANMYTPPQGDDTAKATAILEKYKAQDWMTPELQANLEYHQARVDIRNRDFASAAKRLESIQNTPGVEPSWQVRYRSSLADAYRYASEDEKALAVYNQLLTSDEVEDSIKARAQLMIGIVHFRAKENDKAREAFQKVIDMGDKAHASYIKTARESLEKLDK